MHRTPEINRRIAAYWDEGYSISAIALKTGYDRKTVRVALEERRDQLRRFLPARKEKVTPNE